MVTVAQLQENIATKLLSTLSNSVRADSQFTDDQEKIAIGTTRFQLQALLIGNSSSRDSNDTYIPSLSVAVEVHHYLNSATETEQDYLLGTAQTEHTAIMNPEWWTSITGVFALDEDPELTGADRVGNVLSYTLNAIVAVNTFS